jgi:hypothetical protein
VRSPVWRQRFRQDEETVHCVGQAEGRSAPERHPRSREAEQAADGGPDNEPNTERRADEAVRFRARLGRRHVRDVGERRRHARRRDARQDASDEQPRERRRQRHDDVVEAETGIREQDHRAPAEPIGERSQNRRCDELNRRPCSAEPCEGCRGQRRVAAAERLDEQRQHRDDHAQREHVEQHRDEDEGDGGAAGAWVPELAVIVRLSNLALFSTHAHVTVDPEAARPCSWTILLRFVRFVNKIEAEVALSALEAAGIRAFIQRDDCGGIRPSLWVGGIRLVVRREDIDLATEILDSHATIRWRGQFPM